MKAFRGTLAGSWEWCDLTGMKGICWWACAGTCLFGLNSCFLITIPVKAAGEIVEKSAYATRDLGAAGIRKLREPSQPEPAPYPEPEPYPDPALDGAPDYGSDAYYENQ